MKDLKASLGKFIEVTEKMNTLIKNRKAIKHQLELREKTIILNPHIGNVFHFNKYNDYNRFRINNLHKYIHFPNRRDQLHTDWRSLIKHYQIYNRLPGLGVNRNLMKWANSIIKKYIYPSKMSAFTLLKTA